VDHLKPDLQPHFQQNPQQPTITLSLHHNVQRSTMAEFFDLRGMEEVGGGLGNRGESMNRADAIPFSPSEAGPYKTRFADHGQQPHFGQQPVNTKTSLLPPAGPTRTRKRTQPYRQRIDYNNPNIAKPIDWSKAKFSFSRLNL
jgi:hypothetical protein